MDRTWCSASPIRWVLGVGLPSKEMPLPSPRSFYWGGWGGSLCLVDLDAQIACAGSRHTNKMSHTTMGDPARSRSGGRGSMRRGERTQRA